MTGRIGSEEFASFDSSWFATESNRAQLKIILDRMADGVLVACLSDIASVLINRTGAELLVLSSDELTLDQCKRFWVSADPDKESIDKESIPSPLAIALIGTSRTRYPPCSALIVNSVSTSKPPPNSGTPRTKAALNAR